MTRDRFYFWHGHERQTVRVVLQKLNERVSFRMEEEKEEATVKLYGAIEKGSDFLISDTTDIDVVISISILEDLTPNQLSQFFGYDDPSVATATHANFLWNDDDHPDLFVVDLVLPEHTTRKCLDWLRAGAASSASMTVRFDLIPGDGSGSDFWDKSWKDEPISLLEFEFYYTTKIG